MIIKMGSLDMDIPSVVIAAAAVLAMIVSIITILRQVKDNKTSKTMICLTELFPAYKEVMKNISKALDESRILLQYLEDCKAKNNGFSDFNSNYYSPKYDNFRDTHYFFELLGVLARQAEVNKIKIWRYFTFPIEYFIKTKNIREMIWDNDCLPSYAENFCQLFIMYNTFRKKHGIKWIYNGKKEEPFDDNGVKELTGDFNVYRKL